MGVAAVLTKRDKGGRQQCVDINSQFKGQPTLEHNSYFNIYVKSVSCNLLTIHLDLTSYLDSRRFLGLWFYYITSRK